MKTSCKKNSSGLFNELGRIFCLKANITKENPEKVDELFDFKAVRVTKPVTKELHTNSEGKE